MSNVESAASFDSIDIDAWSDSLKQTQAIEQAEKDALSQPLEGESSLPGQTSDDSYETKTPEQIEGEKVSSAMLLNALFAGLEQMTAAIAGVPFQFEPSCKDAVVEAAYPVLAKQDKGALFGGYVEEATLIITLMTLLAVSVTQVKRLKSVEGKPNESTTATALSKSH
ncbi:hypothetical protein JKJ11_08595 [Vibrio sp. SCSIO 43133]|uniref:hypothetical protein n=1 Tax=Vibrio sp. SCSIO 43133 TaxID=2802577 RepID=UPI0020750E9E|nr:hypothetical protein [Vibrio sp. SCSIO 43133]USD99048.1 hypothetical protein JKJ11_08595 [Vibrio sp. SCSIO 43133]